MTSCTCGRFTAGFLAVAAVALAGCGGTTYGTGTSPGRQTLTDLVGIASLTGEKKEPIEYAPRPPVVAPPEAAGLPPPGSDNPTLASDWPNDPDEQAKRLNAGREKIVHTDENLPLNSKDPKFRLASTPKDWPATSAKDDMTEKEREALAMKLYADARGAVAVDENGNPVRRYLSEPPTEYRVPDPGSPVEIVEKKKKKKKFQLFGWWRDQ